jgi:hypothetical protein
VNFTEGVKKLCKVCRLCQTGLTAKEVQDYGDICQTCNDKEIGKEAQTRMTVDEIDFLSGYHSGRRIEF